jgi:hypothetical protein
MISNLKLLVTLVCGFFAAEATAQQLLLEDFSSMRKNPDGENLWSAYLGEDPNQTFTLENGMMKLVGEGRTSGDCYKGCGIYWHFLPYPYISPTGFAHNYIKSGTWDTGVNRLRFKMKCGQSVTRHSDGGPVVEIGTYVKPTSNTDQSLQGTHYYHQLDFNVYANRWILLEVNQQPQHELGGNPGTLPPLDPEWTGSTPVHYLDGLTRFYFDTMGDGWVNHVCYFDDFSFEKVTGSPDSFVSSITATHSGSKYEVTWATPKNQNLTYRIRYSTTSLKTAGFESGTDGGTVASTGNDYTGVIWLSPNMPESPTGLYVGIQPPGQSVFTQVYIPPMNITSGGPTCDVTGDSVVNNSDVTAETNMALGSTACTNDLDGDGTCTVVDVQRVINASLGSTCRTGP